MRRVKTRPELAEEDRRDLSAGSQQDQEHFLKLRKCGLKTPRVLWQSAVFTGSNYGHTQFVLYQDSFICLFHVDKLNYKIELQWL